MNNKLHSTTTMTALIRTAEWSVDSARQLHRIVTLEHAAHESEHESAKTSAEQAEQFTRELMSRSAFGPDMLILATINHASVNDEVERTARVLGETSRRLADAHQELIQARTTLQLYERLRQRRTMLQQQDANRRVQREQDDAGAMLKGYENSTAVKLTEQGIADGY